MRWHYTTGEFFPQIIESKAIALSNAYVDVERPGVWFSSNQHYDQSARGKQIKTKNTVSGKEEVIRLPMEVIAEKGGVFRLGVLDKDSPVSWETYKAESGIQPNVVAEMEAKYNNKDEWSCSYDPVPMSKWRRVEAFEVANGLNRWIPALSSTVGKIMLEAGLLSNLKTLVFIEELGDRIAILTPEQAALLLEYLKEVHRISGV